MDRPKLGSHWGDENTWKAGEHVIIVQSLDQKKKKSITMGQSEETRGVKRNGTLLVIKHIVYHT